MNPSFEVTCDQCGAPMSQISIADSTHPPESVLRRRRFRPPRTIVLIGIWMIFLPNFLGTAYGAFWLMKHRGGLAEFIAFWGEVGLTCLSFVMLFRVTKYYFFRGAKQEDRNGVSTKSGSDPIKAQLE